MNISKTGITIVKFGAAWCAPCHMLDKELDKYKNDSSISIQKIDIDENMELATEFAISSVPMMRIYKDGEFVTTLNGAMTKSALDKELATIK